jgi:hypothetical protein
VRREALDKRGFGALGTAKAGGDREDPAESSFMPPPLHFAPGALAGAGPCA